MIAATTTLSIRRRWLAVLLGGALVAPLATASPAEASPDPYRGQGVVTRVADGDTARIRLDGRTDDPLYRLLGIQAPEIGECGDDLTTNRLTQLIGGKRVTLRSSNAGSVSDGRPIRSFHVGSTDVTEVMLRDGMGFWFPLPTERTEARRYHVAATEARLSGRGIWNDTLCGPGPSPGHPIEMWVKSDADSDDARNVNGEYVVVVNRHPSRDLDVSGWTLRESSQARAGAGVFRFPAGATIAPDGGRVRVHVGRGTNTTTSFYMGSPDPLFDNADMASGAGDGAYLQDPRGNVRSAFTYPCAVGCATPLAGALRIDHVEYDPAGVDTADTEFIRLRNTSNARIELDGYQLREYSTAYEFRAGTYLDAGETLTVNGGRGTSTRTMQYWGKTEAFLANGGDFVEVASFDERLVECRSWGTFHCFRDVQHGDTHAENIRRLSHERITSGYADRTYRPRRGVTRAQMATFIATALDLERISGSRFGDVPANSTHAGAINAVVEAGIANGVGNGNYAPNRIVTREQMASFLAAAADLDPITTQRFSDVPPGGTHSANVNAVAEAGIANGIGGGRYAPKRTVTREQMATFLMAMLDRR